MAWRRGLLLLAAAAMLGGLFLLVRQVRRPPAWWAPPAATAETAERAASIEQSLAAAFSRVRAEGETWTLRVTEGELNAWLAERLPRWIESGFLGEAPPWPPSLGVVQVHLGGGRVEVAVELLDLGTVARLVAVPAADAKPWRLEWSGAGLGRIEAPLAADALRRAFARRLGGLADAEAVAAILHGGAAMPQSLRLADGRLVRLEGGAVGEGEVRLELATVAAAETRREGSDGP